MLTFKNLEDFFQTVLKSALAPHIAYHVLPTYDTLGTLYMVDGERVPFTIKK